MYLVCSNDLKLKSVLTYADLNIPNIKLSKYHVRVASLDLMHQKFIQPNSPPLPQAHHTKPSEFPVNEWNLLTLGKKGLYVKTSMIYRMILDKSGARRCQIWVKTPEAAQVTSLGGESRRCCCCYCCTNRSTFLCEVALKFLYLYDFTRDKVFLRMLEQKTKFSWYEFLIKNNLYVGVGDFLKTIWMDIKFAKAKFVCRCRIPWTAYFLYFFHSDQDWKYRNMSRDKSSTTSKRLFPRCVLARFASLVSKEQGRVSGDSEKFSLPKKKMTSGVLLNTHFYTAK